MQRTKQVNHSDGMKIMTESNLLDEVEFQGTIIVDSIEEDGETFITLSMPGNVIELTIEEAAVLFYQLKEKLQEQIGE